MCCFGDRCPLSVKALHIVAAVIWACGVCSVNSKLIIYLITVSKGYDDEYDIKCFPDASKNNRVWIPFLIGATIAVLQTPYFFKFILRNAMRIDSLKGNGGYFLSKEESCYHWKFLTMLCVVIMSFTILDVQLCGNDLKSENVSGSKCVYIGLDACIGLTLLFAFSGFIRLWWAKMRGTSYQSMNNQSLNPENDMDDP